VYAPSTSTNDFWKGYEPVMNVEQTRGVLRRVRAASNAPVVGDRLDAERLHGAVLLGGELGADVVIARERVRLDVLGAVLDPLHRRSSEHRCADRENVARIHRHLSAEAAADVRRDGRGSLFSARRGGRRRAR